MTEAIFTNTRQLFRELRFLLSPSESYLQHKYQDHRRFTIIISIFLSVLWASLWYWDVVTDPQGAEHTLVFRLLYLTALSMSLLLYLMDRTSRWLAVFVVTGMLLAEFNFIVILSYLDVGWIYGLGGFMYCMFIAILTLQPFSLRTNIVYTFIAALLPQLLGHIGFIDHFPHAAYGALIWPAAILTVLAQFVQAHHYLLRYHLEQTLEESSVTDPLTGAKNRRGFTPLLEQEMRKSKRSGQALSLLMLDIDHFKAVNDTYGHPTGDLVIKNLSETCFNIARNIDVVARLGGEEFAVMLISCNQQKAVEVAERIRQSIEAQTMTSLDGQSFQFTVSIGVAELNSSIQNQKQLLSLADKALYQAKETGRNKVVMAET